MNKRRHFLLIAILFATALVAKVCFAAGIQEMFSYELPITAQMSLVDNITYKKCTTRAFSLDGDVYYQTWLSDPDDATHNYLVSRATSYGKYTDENYSYEDPDFAIFEGKVLKTTQKTKYILDRQTHQTLQIETTVTDSTGRVLQHYICGIAVS